MSKRIIEVCFSPALYKYFENKEAIVIIVDILRASSAICTAFMNGVKSIIPVATLEEAEDYKKKGYLVAAERDGIVRNFADFGNSPFNFTRERVEGKSIVYSTTNGTQAIEMASLSYRVIIGSFLNFSAINSYVVKENRNVLVFCAGWKNKFNLEDTLYAGAVTDYLLLHNHFSTICDSALASRDLWNLAKNDLTGYIEKAAQRHRLKKNKLDDVLEYCHTLDISSSVPVLKDGIIISLAELTGK